MTAGLGLSPAAASVWAKSQRSENRAVIGSLPLWQHLDDAADTAALLWDEWLPASTRTAISSELPLGETDGRLLYRWLAGVHDIGKCSPAFAVQVNELAAPMRTAGLSMPEQLPDRASAPHATVGQHVLTDWLVDRGWQRRRAHPFAVVVGAHHGSPPGAGNLAELVNRPDLVGAGLWATVRRELLDRTVHRLELDDALTRWQNVRLPVTAQALLTAAVIVADWLASNTELFLYEHCTDQRARVDAAWNQLRLPHPWLPDGSDPLPHFAQRFRLPAGTAPRPLQIEAVRLAHELTEPGLLIIEAPMGEGKTEAALLAAEVLAARSGAGGVFVALPTQATSNAMFRRVASWLRALPGMTGAEHAVTLAHGKAHLDEQFHILKNAGRFCDVGRDEDGGSYRKRHDLIAHSWLTGRKKGTLASSVIGTIDQVLLASLKARHNMLRHLAFTGKVMLLDEVHAYDVFMNVFLLRTVEWLGAYRVPTILLSATLPAQRRAELAEAYRRGWNAIHQSTSDPLALPEVGYPVLTGVSGEGPAVVRPVAAAPRRTPVQLGRLDEDLAVLVDLLRAELAEGGCAAVIRNTVGRVQQAARHLADALPEAEMTVLHSRYLSPDRTRIEKRLVQQFGPNGSADRRGRPQIVVASQVVEQSLDLDFDLMITDLAPADLVLQRMGRLHRHQRGVEQSERAPRLRAARCLVTGVDWSRTPPKPVSGSVSVYEGYPLYAALATLQPFLDGERPLVLPDDISPVVQAAYDEPAEVPAGWAATVDDAWQKFGRKRTDRTEKAGIFRLGPPKKLGADLIGWHEAGVGNNGDEERGAAHVRDGLSGLEVIVVQRDADGGLVTPTWLPKDGGRSIPADLQVTPWTLAQVVASCTMPLPPVLSMPKVIDRVIDDLERNYFPGWQQTHQLAGQLVLVLDEQRSAELAGHVLTYHPVYGLEYHSD